MIQFDFPTILFLAAVVTGAIWGLDRLVWRPRRMRKTAEGEQAKEPAIVEYARSFFPIIVAVLVLRSFLVEPFRIPSGSMMPTLIDGDFILVNKFDYGIRLPVINEKIISIGEPHRGDVVVFRFPEDPSTDFIKRIVGLPGDHIEYHNNRVYINGKPLKYQRDGVYIGKGTAVSMSGAEEETETIGKIKHKILLEPGRSLEAHYTCMKNNTSFDVPKGQYFVMGDNRDNSNDSRYWCGVPEKNLVGKAFLIWMNWDKVDGRIGWSRIGTRIR
jgi:signal peptidase I